VEIICGVKATIIVVSESAPGSRLNTRGIATTIESLTATNAADKDLVGNPFDSFGRCTAGRPAHSRQFHFFSLLIEPLMSTNER
jgi:hypothetical protein